MRIVLFDPTEKFVFGEYGNTFFPSLGLGYIAGSLRQAGHEVIIINVNSEDDLNVLTCEQYDLVGITGNANQLPGIFKIAAISKSVNSDAKVVVGGGVASTFVNCVLENEWIDFVVIGEGELTIVQLLEAVKNKWGFNGISNLAWKLDGEIVVNSSRNVNLDLDSLIFPVHDLQATKSNCVSRFDFNKLSDRVDELETL